MQRWERRERKKKADKGRMKKSGTSVKLILRILGERAARAEAAATIDPPKKRTQRKPNAQ